MFAFALNSQPGPERSTAASVPGGSSRARSKQSAPLTVHERMVMRAEAVFPGSEIVSHVSASQR